MTASTPPITKSQAKGIATSRQLRAEYEAKREGIDIPKRRRARRRPGPRTEAGKAAVSLNAVKHGITAGRVPLPGEDLSAWEAHRQSIFDAAEPVGAIEEMYAQSIAELSWRLRRVMPYEETLAATARERVPQEFKKKYGWADTATVEEAEEALEGAIEAQENLPEGSVEDPDGPPSRKEPVATQVKQRSADPDSPPSQVTDAHRPMMPQRSEGPVATQVKQRSADPDGTPSRVRDSHRPIMASAVAEFDAAIQDAGATPEITTLQPQTGVWTAATIAAAVIALAHHRQISVDDMTGQLSGFLEGRAMKYRERLNFIIDEQDRMRRDRILPPQLELLTLNKYETGLHRMLFQNVHELEAAQARRHGEPTSLLRMQISGA